MTRVWTDEQRRAQVEIMSRRSRQYWQKRRLKQIVASEYARKVFELTAWIEPRALPIRENNQIVGYHYTLGFLVRKVLPDHIHVSYHGPRVGWKARADHSYIGEDGGQWITGDSGHTARTPEDAVCKLIIHFIEQGYITKEAA